MPPNTVYVGRPNKWGNPWSVKNTVVILYSWPGGVIKSRPATFAECVDAYRDSITSREFGFGVEEIRYQLAGRNLACWCPLDQPCHADYLLEVANLISDT